jgi:transcription elongation factor Elf1
MQVTETIQCPCCGRKSTLEIDTSIPSQNFWMDCEACCLPLEVTINCEPGEVLSLDVQPG